MIKIIEGNRESSSHQLHCDPSNSAVIKEVTHMWESPSVQINEEKKKKERRNWALGKNRLKLLQSASEFRELKKKGSDISYTSFAKDMDIPKSVFYRHAKLPKTGLGLLEEASLTESAQHAPHQVPENHPIELLSRARQEADRRREKKRKYNAKYYCAKVESERQKRMVKSPSCERADPFVSAKPKYITINDNYAGEKKSTLGQRSEKKSTLGQRSSERNEARCCSCANKQARCVWEDKAWIPATKNCKNSKHNIMCNPDNCTFGDAGCRNRIGETYLTSCYPKKSQNEKMGFDLVAFEPIPKNVFLGQYVGKLEPPDCKPVGKYVAMVNARDSATEEIIKGVVLFYIDAEKMGNLTRFANHSCEPNCIFDQWQVEGEEQIWLKTLKDIKRGDPITYDYGDEARDFFENGKCLCDHCSK